MARADLERMLAEEEREKMSGASNEKVNKAMEKYLRLRDEIEVLNREHQEKTAAIKAEMQQFEDAFGKLLNQWGLENYSCSAGTVFRTTHTSTSVADWNATLDYIRDKGAWELLERRVNKTAVVAIMEETAEQVPGVTVKQFTKTSIRRK